MMLGIEKKGIEGRNSFHVVEWKGFGCLGEEGLLQALGECNCDVTDGKLRRGVGVAPLRNESGQEMGTAFDLTVPRAYYEGGVVYYVADDGYAYRLERPSGASTQLGYVGENADCTFMDTKEGVAAVFAGEKGSVAILGQTLAPLPPIGIRLACVCADRLFLASDRTVFYSAPYDPFTWEGGTHEGGSLRLPLAMGELVAMASFDGDLYLFGREDVCRVRVSATATDFRLEPLHCKVRGICLNGACAVGEGVFFLAKEGAFLVKGNSIQPALSGVALRANPERECSFGRCGRLLLLAYEDLDSGRLRRLAISPDGQKCFAVDGEGDFGGGDLVWEENRFYRLLLEGEEAEYAVVPRFTSKGIDFGKKGFKTLRRLLFFGRGEAELTLTADGRARSYPLSFTDGRAELTLVERGREFSLALAPQADTEIVSVRAEYFA